MSFSTTSGTVATRFSPAAVSRGIPIIRVMEFPVLVKVDSVCRSGLHAASACILLAAISDVLLHRQNVVHSGCAEARCYFKNLPAINLLLEIIKLGKPPAMPGDSVRFDRSGSRVNE
jgi:hypothetical protein